VIHTRIVCLFPVEGEIGPCDGPCLNYVLVVRFLEDMAPVEIMCSARGREREACEVVAF
jgi:hypothetical protein